MKTTLITLFILFSWFAYSSELDGEWHRSMMTRQLQGMTQSITAFSDPQKFLNVIQEFADFKEINEFDQAALKRIHGEISVEGGDIEIATFLAMNLSSHAMTSFSTFELALSALNTNLPYSEATENFYSFVGRYVSDSFYHFVGPNTPALQSMATDHFKDVLSDLIRKKDSAAIVRWLKISRMFAGGIDPLLGLFAENYTRITVLLNQEAQLDLLVGFIGDFSYVREVELIQREAIMSQIRTYLEGGPVKTRLRLLEALQFWKPPAEFRPELIALAFDSKLPEVKRAARKALFYSYGGYIKPPRGTPELAVGYEYHEKTQIYRNFRAWLSIQRAAACRLALKR